MDSRVNNWKEKMEQEISCLERKLEKKLSSKDRAYLEGKLAGLLSACAEMFCGAGL